MNAKSKITEADDPCDKKIKCKVLQIEETKYRTLFTRKFENRKVYSPPDPDKIHTVLPGTVLEVFVKAGQTVKAGDPLIIFEAMKMRNKIVASFDGRIQSLNVKKGDIIAKGQLVAVMG